MDTNQTAQKEQSDMGRYCLQYRSSKYMMIIATVMSSMKKFNIFTIRIS